MVLEEVVLDVLVHRVEGVVRREHEPGLAVEEPAVDEVDFDEGPDGPQEDVFPETDASPFVQVLRRAKRGVLVELVHVLVPAAVGIVDEPVAADPLLGALDADLRVHLTVDANLLARDEAARPVRTQGAVLGADVAELVVALHEVGDVLARGALTDLLRKVRRDALVGVHQHDPMPGRLINAEVLLSGPVAVERPVEDPDVVEALRDLQRPVRAAVINEDDLVGERAAHEAGLNVDLLIARHHDDGYAFLHTGLPGSLNLTEI